MSVPLVSCLCVTEGRPQFMPWLLWNFDKQDHGRRELLVVDSSERGPGLPSRPDVTVVRCPPGTSVPRKRNLALERSRGELVAWFDDDDWQHPRRLSLLADALRDAAIAGTCGGWFVDLATGRARAHSWPRGPLFNGAGVSRELAAGVAFDESRRQASDTPWLLAVGRRAAARPALLDEPLFFWLCHERNLSNPAGSRRFPEPLGAVRRAVGEADWGDTEEQLAALRRRLRPRPARRPRARTRVCVVVTTYMRPDGLERLLDDLERERGGCDLDVRVYDDASPRGYAAVERRLRDRGWTYVRADENHGKRSWWRWWNRILADLRRTEADLYLLVQDDVRLCTRFFERSLGLWSEIPDPRKASLFLHLDAHTASGRPRWTPFRERPAGEVVRCGWLDHTAAICNRRLFEALDWHLDPVPARWSGDPLRSSGVGAQLSARLHRLELGMYRVARSLTVHGDGPSVMNPEARRRFPMRTVRFVDGDAAAARLAGGTPSVCASLASVPGRERGLAAVVEALLPQVDRLGVYLNGYRRAPAFLDDPRVRVVRSQEHGDRGDAGKFFWAEDAGGYVLICDDDLHYPPDYVARLLAGIDRYEGRAAVGFHGALLDEQVADYYASRRPFHFSRALAADTPVHVLGTGAAGYHASAIAVGSGDFPKPNMADVYFALAGQRRRVPFVCLAHEEGWLREIPGSRAGSIYERDRASRSGARSEQTRLVRAHRGWSLHGDEPRPPALGPNVRLRVAGPSREAALLLPSGDHITLAIQRSGTYYERDLLDAIRARVRGGTFVDLGAHYGNHTLFFLLECGARRVVAVEPNPESFDGLVANLRANDCDGRVTALREAVHPKLGRVEAAALPWSRRHARARTNSGRFGVVPAAPGQGVPAAPLDETLAPFRSISALKVDVEELGVEIVGSGIGVLERDRPLVAVEAPAGEQLERLRRLLEPLGYALVGRFCWTPTWLWVADREAGDRPRS